MADDARTARAKAEQDYESSPPRCVTCVYFRREPHTLFSDRQRISRRGRIIHYRVKLRAHPRDNPIVDRCSFGNFLTKPHAICNEWRTRDGERLVDSEAAFPENGRVRRE